MKPELVTYSKAAARFAPKAPGGAHPAGGRSVSDGDFPDRRLNGFLATPNRAEMSNQESYTEIILPQATKEADWIPVSAAGALLLYRYRQVQLECLGEALVGCGEGRLPNRVKPRLASLGASGRAHSGR